MSAAVRRLLVLLAVLALAGGAGACGSDSDESSGGGDSENATTDKSGGGDSENATTDKSGGANNGGDADDEEIRDEEPTANNEVLLGAAFFGEQPADFGAVVLGKTRKISFTLNSLGTSRTINGTSIIGDHAGDFSLDPGSCTNGAVVDAGESCTVLITFKPSVAGVRKASLRVEIDPGVSGGRSLTGNGGLKPTPPPATNTNPDATRTEQTDDTPGGAKSGGDDTGGATASP